MKKIVTFIILIQLQQSFSQKIETPKQIYIDEFKMVYFCDCIKHGFNNSKEIKNILKADNSTYSELILGNRYLLIDSLAIQAAEKIKTDSILFSKNRAEGAKGKKVFAECLSNYQSKWLHNLAKKEYKKN